MNRDSEGKLPDISAVEAAMAKVEAVRPLGSPGPLWWDDGDINRVLNAGVAAGYLARLSMTQVQWTETGAKVSRAAREADGKLPDAGQSPKAPRVLGTVSAGVAEDLAHVDVDSFDHGNRKDKPEFSYGSGAMAGSVRRMVNYALSDDGLKDWPERAAEKAFVAKSVNDLQQHQYAFDCTLEAAIRVKATSREEAEAHIRATMDAADCNGGAWPNGDPILFEASVNDNPLVLYEIDGEFINATVAPQASLDRPVPLSVVEARLLRMALGFYNEEEMIEGKQDLQLYRDLVARLDTLVDALDGPAADNTLPAPGV